MLKKLSSAAVGQLIAIGLFLVILTSVHATVRAGDGIFSEFLKRTFHSESRKSSDLRTHNSLLFEDDKIAPVTTDKSDAQSSPVEQPAAHNVGPKPVTQQLAVPEPSNVLSIVSLILDEQASDQDRNQAISDHPELAADLITAMASDLQPGTSKESARIPWIWNVAFSTGKRNDAEQIARVLDAGLPVADESLAPWQATVVGGGIVSGLSQQGIWPAERIREIVADDAFLEQRWQRAIRLSEILIEDGTYPNGTRYDALRIVAMQPWRQSGPTLTSMMDSNVRPELQMGAVSGVVDATHPQSARVLISSMPNLAPANREIAIDGLFRTTQRRRLLREALQNRRLNSKWLSAKQLRVLQSEQH